MIIPHSNWNIPDDINSIGNDVISKIDKEGGIYFPVKDKIFRFMEADFNNLRYIIVGMDPYASTYDDNGIKMPIATGRSFEVSNMHSWTQKVPQASIRNILCAIYYAKVGTREPLAKIRDHIEDGSFKILPPNEWYAEMERQGILFLNASLTVHEGMPGSHAKYWNDYMTKLSGYIVRTKNPVWLLWGNDAKGRFKDIVPKDKAIYAHHPRLQDFIKDNPFSYLEDIDITGYRERNCNGLQRMLKE